MSGGIVFILAAVLLDMFGLDIIALVLPRLVITVFALMQFVCSPRLGVLSDRFGRRAVIALSDLGHEARKLSLMSV